MSMSVQIPVDRPVSPPPPGAACDVIEDGALLAPANARPVPVLISPIVAVPADGAAPAGLAAAALPPAYTGVLYTHHHHIKWPVVVDDPGKKREKWLKEMRGWLMVLAVLAASVTYQAGLNPPGGFWQQDDAQGNVAGTPVLQSKFPKRSVTVILSSIGCHYKHFLGLIPQSHGTRYVATFPIHGSFVPDRETGRSGTVAGSWMGRIPMMVGCRAVQPALPACGRPRRAACSARPRLCGAAPPGCGCPRRSAWQGRPVTPEQDRGSGGREEGRGSERGREGCRNIGIRILIQ
jgi:hypothetical protein